jgi:ribonuclease D
VNVFATQIAAGVCGLDDIMGYGRLCKQLLNVEVDKTLQKANWLQRPLSKDLMNYALKDIEYLPALYRELSHNIDSRKLWDAYFARSAKLTDKQNYKVQPDKILDKMRLSDESKEFQSRLKDLILFREECAQTLNIPRGFCASDSDLINIARTLPTNDLEFSKLRIQNSMVVKRNFKDKLFELCIGLKSL